MHCADHTFDSDTNKWCSCNSAKKLWTFKNFGIQRVTFNIWKGTQRNFQPSPPLHPPPIWHHKPQASLTQRRGLFGEKCKGCLFLCCAANFWCLTLKGEGSPIFPGLAFHTAPTEFTDNRIFLKVLRILNKEHRSQHFKIVCQFKLGKKNSQGQLGIGNQFHLHR